MNWLIFSWIIGMSAWVWFWIASAINEDDGGVAFTYSVLAIPLPLGIIAGLLFA